MAQAERDMLRIAWCRRHCPDALECAARYERALNDATQFAHLAHSFVEGLTDADAIAEGEAAGRAAKAAVNN